MLHCKEPKSFEVAKATFMSQGAYLYECQNSERCFLTSKKGE